MIYSDEFVWIHFPKVAGTKIEEIFRDYFKDDVNIKQDSVGENRADGSHPWHDSIDERINYEPNFDYKEKRIIVCIRKLPGWLRSRFNFEVDRNPNLEHNIDRLREGRFLESNGYLNHADYYIKKYLPEHVMNHPKLTFIRMEEFEEDFKSAFKDFIDLSIIPDETFRQRSNASNSHIDKSWFNDERTCEMYKKSPLWSAVEKIVY